MRNAVTIRALQSAFPALARAKALAVVRLQEDVDNYAE